MFSLGLLAALLTLLFFSIGDTLSKPSSEKLGHKLSAAIIVGSGMIPLGISLFFIHPNVFSLGVLGFGAVAGVLTAVGFLLVFKSLESEQVTNTMALVNIQYASVILFGAFALGESISSFQLGGLLLIFSGVILVTVTRSFKLNFKLLPALLGMLFWGLDLIVIVYALTLYQNSTTMISFLSRIAGGAFLFLYLIYVLRSKGNKPAAIPRENLPRKLGLAVIAGSFDGLALMMVTFVTLFKSVELGGAVMALEPVLIAIYGYFLYKDRLHPLQLLGVIIAVAGGVLLNFF